jgi:arylsulfatase A-like enzyme
MFSVKKRTGFQFFPAAALIAVGLLVGGACARGEKDGIHSYRFIDKLTDAGVMESPLRETAWMALGERAFPIDSILMPEAGRGEAALGAKRKLNLGLIEIDILFAPPRSEYRYSWAPGAGGTIDLGIGIIRDNNSIGLAGSVSENAAGVSFLVILESEGHKKVIFDRHLSPPAPKESRTLNQSQHRIAVPALKKEGTITLLTAGTRNAFSFWYNPVFTVPDSKAPNVVLISIDTLRPDHLGSYGYPKPVSPAIDSLAADGAVFENVYSTAPWTLPAHVSMLTGLNNVRHRVYYEKDKLDPRVPTLAEKMRERGYATGAVTGAGFVNASFGFAKGFDSYAMNQADLVDPRLAEEGGKDAVAWIEAHNDRPFFLFVHTYQVHCPYKSPNAYIEKFTRDDPWWRSFEFSKDLGGRAGAFGALTAAERTHVIGLYDAGVRYTDDTLIKPIIDELRRLGLYDRTLIVVTSDHGEEFYDHGGWNHTHSVFDELIRIPLILKMPGSEYRGRRYTPLVRVTDIMPTILDAADVSLDGLSINGRSLRSVLEGREKADRIFSAELAEDAAGIIIPQRVATNEGRLKIILNQPFTEEQWAFYKTKPPAPGAIEFFDLHADPGETRNLADRPDLAPQVRALLEQARKFALLIPRKDESKGKFDKALEDQLRALGYIR